MPAWLPLIIQLLEALLPIFAKKQMSGAALTPEEEKEKDKIEHLLKIAKS